MAMEVMKYVHRGVTSADSPGKKSLFGVKLSYHHRLEWRMSGGQILT